VVDIIKEGNKFEIKYDFVPVKSSIPNNEFCEKVLKEFEEVTKEKLKKVLAFVEEEYKLDIKTSTVRTNESNMGNFICDVIKNDINCDCVTFFKSYFFYFFKFLNFFKFFRFFIMEETFVQIQFFLGNLLSEN
jgi:hypothetical protein